MSTRADIFPPAFIEELKKLQDQVEALPFEAVRPVMEKQLGRPLGEVFARFDPTALAAASVAQVHRATLFTGEQVAVKIVRPAIARVLREDIRLMFQLAGRLEKRYEPARLVGAVNLVKEFERTVFRELDMFIEAGSIEKFAANFRGVDDIVIPQVHWEVTSRSVLVMTFIEGVKMDQVEKIRALGIDPKHIALIGLESFALQLLRFGFFHADPHPANTIVTPQGKVGLVDFGITGYLDDELMRHLAGLFLGYAEHNYGMVMESLIQARLIDPQTMDMNSFRLDLKDASELFYGRNLQTIAAKDVCDQVMVLVLKYRLRLPRNLLLLMKTFVQTEALGKILDSDASLLEITRPHAKRLLAKGRAARSTIEAAAADLQANAALMRTVPRLLHTILQQTAGGTQRIALMHTGFDRMENRLDKWVNRLTVGLIISASTIAGSLVLNSSQKVIEFTFDFLGGQTVALTSLLGITGYTIATVLGIWLILSIFRSGKL
jgi:ubiquinone biosynthesis protein